MSRMVVLLLVGFLWFAFIPPFANAFEEPGMREGAFLIKKDKMKVPRKWGRLVTIYTAQPYTYLVFEDEKGTLRHVIYEPENGIPGAVRQIDWE